MFWTVLFTCVLHQLAERQVILDFWLNLPVQHVSLRTAQPLAAFLSCDCGSICYAADLAEASPRQGSWPWCLTSPSDILPLPSGDEGEGHILTATVRKRPVTTREKLCFLSLPIFHFCFYKSAWHACKHARPARKTLRRILQWNIRLATQ